MTTGRRRCSPWWTDSSGTHRGRRNHLCLRSCNRCLLSCVAWATRCDRLLAVLTPLDRRQVPRHLRVEVTAHHCDLVATIRRSSVLAAVSWDTRKLAAPSQIHLYHSDRTVGMTGRMDHSDTTADPHTGKRNIGRDLTHTGLYVIDSDHASSLPVISDLHPEYSSASTYGNFYHVAMKSVTKRNRRKSQREAARLKRQGAPGPTSDDEDMEVHFKQPMDTPDSPPASPPPSPTSQGETDYAIVLDMVQNLRDKLSALNLDNENIRAACDALRRQCQDQGVAFGDLSKLVKQSLEGRQSQQPREETGRPHPLIRPDLIDSRGNLRATDIGITWQGGDTFLHGVRVAGPEEDIEDTRPRPATSTPYPPVREHPSCGMSTPRPLRPVCIEIPETPTHRTSQEGRPGYRPAAPIQRFNNKSIGWPAWFRHFKAVADVHGWDKDQRALQIVSYLDEKAMNVTQELSDRELYDYDVLIKLLGDRFDPASRVSASRSRFHGRTRRHQEDADTYADSIT